LARRDWGTTYWGVSRVGIRRRRWCQTDRRRLPNCRVAFLSFRGSSHHLVSIRLTPVGIGLLFGLHRAVVVPISDPSLRFQICPTGLVAIVRGGVRDYRAGFRESLCRHKRQQWDGEQDPHWHSHHKERWNGNAPGAIMVQASIWKLHLSTTRCGVDLFVFRQQDRSIEDCQRSRAITVNSLRINDQS
jgi:hypothetical protein